MDSDGSAMAAIVDPTTKEQAGGGANLPARGDVPALMAWIDATLRPAEPTGGTPFEQALRRAEILERASLSAATRTAYRTDIRAFVAWCTGLAERPAPLPAEATTIRAYIAMLDASGKGVSAIGRALAAIRLLHELAGISPSPTASKSVALTMKGIRKRKDRPPTTKKEAITIELLETVVAQIPEGLRGTRDRALILLGFAGAFRRSELVALDVEDLEARANGLLITVRWSKGDQEGRGQRVAIKRRGGPLCAVEALERWIAAAGLVEGPIFRRCGVKVGTQRLHDQEVARAVKKYVGAMPGAGQRGGLDTKRFAGHSLRRGALTSASARGASVWKLQELSRHRSIETLQEYVQVTDLFKDHALDGAMGSGSLVRDRQQTVE